MKKKKAEILNAHQPLPWSPGCPLAGLTCLSFWAHAREGGHTVNAGGARSAGGKGAVIYVLAAVVSTPAVNTDAAIAPITVGAGAPILTGIGLQQALVHILCAELPFGGKSLGLWLGFLSLRRCISYQPPHILHPHVTCLKLRQAELIADQSLTWISRPPWAILVIFIPDK